ncbi:8055_t:CDS:2, partial [Dentiscutata erythropus]
RVQLPNGLISRGSLDAGYHRVAREKYRVHHLVALAFCPKEEKNVQHAIRLGFQHQRVVKQIFDDGSFREFPSIAEARCVTGIDHAGGCCCEY